MRSLMLRLAGFAGAPLLSALAPFIILPVVSRIVGEDGWANFSTGQSVGILGMVGVLFGWSVVGPVRIARSTSPHERAVILQESLRSRAVTAIVAVPIAGAVTYVIASDSYRLESVLVAVAMTLGGFTPAWFCIGQGNPGALMLYDAGPKLAASLVSLPILLLTGAVIWYPILFALFVLPAAALHAVNVARDHDPSHGPPAALRRVLRTLVPTALIDGTGNAYGSTPVPIATAGLPADDASAFASADRMYRVALLAVVAIGNGFQAWVLQPDAVDPRRRQLAALGAHIALGILGGALIALLGPWATGFLFGADVAAQPLPSALFGLAFLFISTATPLIRNVLIPAGRYRTVFAATIAAAGIGLAVMLVGSFASSAPLISLGVVAAEFTSLAMLAVPAALLLRRPPQDDAHQ